MTAMLGAMREPWEWTEQDLLALIKNQTPESITLDYKACASLKNGDKEKDEISKDVSAFANSGGGTIVYGMVEERGSGRAEGLDEGYDPTVTTAEWLDQVIASRIQPRIDGVRINAVRLDTQRPSRVAYVVSVPESTRAPHQARDKKFYKRFERQSVPMEEYEIRDVARRGQVPDLRVEIAFTGTPGRRCYVFDDGSRSFGVMFSVGNHGRQPAKFALINALFDPRFDVSPAPTSLAHDTVGWRLDLKRTQILWSVYDLQGPSAGMPLFTKTAKMIHRATVAIPGGIAEGRFMLGSDVQSPDMEGRLEFTVLRYRGRQVEFEAEGLTMDEVIDKFPKLLIPTLME
jgi:hypothetical protein